MALIQQSGMFYPVLFIVLGCAAPDPSAGRVWYSELPACPCENPDRNGVQLNDGWAQDAGNIQTYHKGATVCFRSYPAVRTSAGYSGQQCCYDAYGRLITAGSGAGTPDKASTCKGEDANGKMRTRWNGLVRHYLKDVLPWKRLGGPDSAAWTVYNKQWPPNNVQNCPDNTVR